jgi:hypothetical protein
MAFAQGSRSSLGIGVESSFGTAAVTYTNLPIKTHSLDLTKERLQGQDIQADRMQRVDRHGNRNAAGSIEVDLRKGNYDDLLESAFLSTFDSSDQITIGTTPKFLTIEDAMNDIGQYRLFTGMTVSTASFSIAPNQMVETTFEMVGKDMTISGSGKTVAASTINQPFDSYNGAIYEGGVATGDLVSVVTSLEFSITNSFAPTFVVGSETTPFLEYGRAIIEGTMSVYAEDATFINRFINETESELQVSVDDPSGASAYTFYMPRIKYNGASVPLANEQSRIIELPFVALYDGDGTGDLGTALRLTRTS